MQVFFTFSLHMFQIFDPYFFQNSFGGIGGSGNRLKWVIFGIG